MISSKVNELGKQKRQSEAASANYWAGQKVHSEGGKSNRRTMREGTFWPAGVLTQGRGSHHSGPGCRGNGPVLASKTEAGS